MRTTQLLAILVIALGAVASGRKVVCYYASYASYRGVNPEDLDANLCTHINYAFIAVNEDGSLRTEDEALDVGEGLFYRTTDLKNQNGNLKVLLSVGGGSAPSQTFANIAADSGKRAAMVGSARWFLETFHFDGIDIDWEVPGEGDRGNIFIIFGGNQDDRFELVVEHDYLTKKSCAVGYIVNFSEIGVIKIKITWVIQDSDKIFGKGILLNSGHHAKANYIALLQDFRNDFNRNGWLVTAAVSSDPAAGGYDIYQMSQILDHINLMTYDMYGPWSSYTGQNSALWASSVESDWERTHLNMDAAVRNWINGGASADKIIAGIAFYGRTFTLQDPNNNWLHAPITGPGNAGPISGEAGAFMYLEYCQNPGAWSCTWDDEQKMPVCHSGDQWLGYDSAGSITEKVNYINNNNLGGAMIWCIDQDDVKGQCGTRQELLHVIKNIIN